MSEENGAVILESGCAYYAHHIPTGEDWVIIGFNHEYNKVCAAGWPPTIAQLSDCENFEFAHVLTPEELQYRESNFGSNWE